MNWLTDILKSIGELLKDILSHNMDDPIPPPLPPEPVVNPERLKLYERARLFLDKDASPNDKVSDDLACVESLSYILRKHLGEFPELYSTAELYHYLQADPRFKATLDILPGNIIISVTGTGNGNIPHGHCGIIGENGTIMSNDSRDGRWRTNYSISSWIARFRTLGGMKVRAFELK